MTSTIFMFLLDYVIYAVLMFLGLTLKTDSYRMLFIPLQAPSHEAAMLTIAMELISRGHEVHMVLPDGSLLPEELQSSTSGVYVQRYERKSYDGLLIPQFSEIFDNITRMVLHDGASSKMICDYVFPYTHRECRHLLLYNEPLMDRLQNLHFDMVLVDGVHLSKCFHLVPHRLKIPRITITNNLEPWLVKVPWLPSFASTEFAPFSEKMTFMERLQNTLVMFILITFPVLPGIPEDILNKYRTFGHFDSIHDLELKSLLWIITSDATLDYVMPSMPNIVEAPGLTTKPSSKLLPTHISDFIESSENGIIIVSFGSMSFEFPPVLTYKFLSAFSKLGGYK